MSAPDLPDHHRASIAVDRSSNGGARFFTASSGASGARERLVQLCVGKYIAALTIYGAGRQVQIDLTHEELRGLVRILEEVRPDELEGGERPADAWLGPNGPELAP